MAHDDAIRGVEIFAAGEHRDGKAYTPAHLDEMCRNFARNCAGRGASMRVPVVIGHGEDQKFLEDSGLPAAAWVTRVYRQGPKLLADFAHAPPEVMRLVKGRRYRAVSSEVYDEPPKGCSGSGHMLRRVALLGGEIPEVKGLAEIPVPGDDAPRKHSESRERFASAPPARLQFSHAWRSPSRGTFHCFSEVIRMSREELLQKIGQKGGDPAALEGCDDAALAEVLRLLDSQPSDGDEAPADPAPPAPAPSEAGSQFDEDEGEAAPPEEGGGAWDASKFAEPKDEAEWEKMAAHSKDCDDKASKWREHVKKCGERFGKRFGEASPEVTPLTAAPVKKDDGGRKALAYSEAARELKALRVDTFLDRMGLAGKVSPRERPLARRRLLAANDSRLRKFSENGKTWEETDLSAALAEIEARPSYFSERVPDGPGGARDGDDAAGADGQAGETKVRKFAEKHRAKFARMSQTPDDVVNAYKSLRRHDPDLTPERFLTP